MCLMQRVQGATRQLRNPVQMLDILIGRLDCLQNIKVGLPPVG